jgi:hypothetical protein
MKAPLVPEKAAVMVVRAEVVVHVQISTRRPAVPEVGAAVWFTQVLPPSSVTEV